MANELQQVNLNLSVYKRLVEKTTLNEKAKDAFREEIAWLENVVIPQLKMYDV